MRCVERGTRTLLREAAAARRELLQVPLDPDTSHVRASAHAKSTQRLSIGAEALFTLQGKGAGDDLLFRRTTSRWEDRRVCILQLGNDLGSLSALCIGRHGRSACGPPGCLLGLADSRATWEARRSRFGRSAGSFTALMD